MTTNRHLESKGTEIQKIDLTDQLPCIHSPSQSQQRKFPKSLVGHISPEMKSTEDLFFIAFAQATQEVKQYQELKILSSHTLQN